jgi:hypothetical protein
MNCRTLSEAHEWGTTQEPALRRDEECTTPRQRRVFDLFALVLSASVQAFRPLLFFVKRFVTPLVSKVLNRVSVALSLKDPLGGS